MQFRRRTFQLMLAALRSVSPSMLLFHDGGLPDCIAYRQLEGVAIENDILEACSNFRYREVFYLEPLTFSDDGVRIESDADLKRLQWLIPAAYAQFGYEPITIPVGDVKSRVALILKTLTTV